MSLKPLEFPFHVMVKPHGPVCNLACRYCFYLHKQDLLDTASDELLDQRQMGDWVMLIAQRQPPA